jgi:hypothetical protein
VSRDAAVSVRSPAELRRFGVTVGGIFLLLASVSWWRGHEWPPRVLASLGTLLVVPGLLLPRVLGPVERAWMAMAAVLGRVNTRILLSVVYTLVVTPIGFVMRWRHDPLDRELGSDRPTHWRPREDDGRDMSRYRQQF